MDPCSECRGSTRERGHPHVELEGAATIDPLVNDGPNFSHAIGPTDPGGTLHKQRVGNNANIPPRGMLVMIDSVKSLAGLRGTIDFTVIGASFEPRSPRNSVGGRLVRVADCFIRETASKRPVRPERPESGASEAPNPRFFSWRLRRTCCEPPMLLPIVA